MAKYGILKAVEHSKLSAATKKKYPSEQALFEAGWWLQPKYDGCFGMAYIGTDNDRMLSRTGEDYTVSCGHILKELKEAMIDHDGVDFTPTVFLGEVWQPIEEAAFPAVSGKFRRQRPSPELRFMVNDVLPIQLETSVAYSTRHYGLVSILGDMHPNWKVHAVPVGLLAAGNESLTAMSYALGLQGSGGYDGAILRDPDAGYHIAEAKLGEIVKVKPTLSLDLRVVRVDRGEGKHADRAGAIVVSYRGVETGVGTGLSDDERTSWLVAYHSTGWEKTNPGAKTIVEIECLGITADGKLREPRFKGIRHDKLEPDA